jgi:glycosyltransferase involved in cell wall biosynthesis
VISIIIRTKNEERWITPCLKSVFNQSHKDFEVIIVDNKSEDKTIEKAKKFDVKVLKYNEEYRPGKAINKGIKASNGDLVACLSAHCIPINDKWLTNLKRNFTEKDIAAVYGRQEPMSFTPDADKRDLAITFGLDKKIQVKDSFFHNANSMIRRDIWEKIPFDEALTNIEDRAWAKKVLDKNYKIIYEPEASVYHYHGIHQNQNRKRCDGVVKILESLDLINNHVLDTNNLFIVALIPIIGEVLYLNKRPLVEYTIERAKKSKHIDEVIVLTDNEKQAKISRKAGASVPFIRDKKYSSPEIELESVLKYSIEKLEKMGILADIVAILEPTFPFRTPDLIDKLIEQMIYQGLDTITPGKKDYGAFWIEDRKSLKRVDSGDIPRTLKKPIHVGLKGLGCITYPHILREEKIFGENVGILEIDNPYSVLEVRDQTSIEFASKLVDDWEKKSKTNL